MILLQTRHHNQTPVTLDELHQQLEHLLGRTALLSERIYHPHKNARTEAEIHRYPAHHFTELLQENDGQLRVTMEPSITTEHEQFHIELSSTKQIIRLFTVAYPKLDISDVVEVMKIVAIAIKNALAIAALRR